MLREWIRDAAGNSHAPGVYKQVEKEDKETGLKVKSWSWFCSLLEIAAETRDASGQQWGRLLRVTDRDGTVHEWAMPMGMLAGDGTAYREHLLSLGLELAPAKFGRDCLHEYITLWRPGREGPLRRPHRLARPRLRPARCHLSATPGGESVILQTAGHGTGLRHGGDARRLAGRGGPLRRRQQPARRWRSASRSRAAALPPGRGERRLPSRRRLLDGQDDGALLRCVGLGCRGALLARDRQRRRGAWPAVPATPSLPLDEVSQADGRAVDAMAYMLGNGAGKARMRRDASARPIITWRLLFLSTGETGLAAKMQEGGRRARAGQEVRVVEIPADAGAGRGLFENLHGFASGDALARHLRLAAEQHKGHAARAFLDEITKRPGGDRRG